MAIDLATLRKLETLPASEQALLRRDNDRVGVVVKLRKGFRLPLYMEARAEISPELFTAVIATTDLRRFEADPAVESVSISRELPNVR